jgi:hypothetical protein
MMREVHATNRSIYLPSSTTRQLSIAANPRPFLGVAYRLRAGAVPRQRDRRRQTHGGPAVPVVVHTRRVGVHPPGSLGGRQVARANYQASEAYTARWSQSTDSGGEGGRLPGSAQSDGSGPPPRSLDTMNPRALEELLTYV